MSRELRFHEEALSELQSAAEWYDEKRRGLGTELLEALDARLEQLATSSNPGSPLPGMGPESPLRRSLLARFPYVIVFVLTPSAIHVLAVMHGRQRPGYWSRRVPR